ncbi:hypothetical protein EV424DRAFT_1555459 [Suillus variegatus]|nr:hypothetical protein EV424DRAFT_1555459 [Suillus variegatus]
MSPTQLLAVLRMVSGEWARMNGAAEMGRDSLTKPPQSNILPLHALPVNVDEIGSIPDEHHPLRDLESGCIFRVGILYVSQASIVQPGRQQFADHASTCRGPTPKES